MSKLKLEDYVVFEMKHEELLQIEGGSFRSVLESIAEFVVGVAAHIAERVQNLLFNN